MQQKMKEQAQQVHVKEEQAQQVHVKEEQAQQVHVKETPHAVRSHSHRMHARGCADF
jgi:hypothetical protein